MKILSSIYSPSSSSKPVWCLCSAEHKGRYSEECGKQSSSGAPLTSIVFFFSTMEVTNFLQNIFLSVRQNKEIHTGFGTTWGWVNDDRIFIFGWTIPLSATQSSVYLPSSVQISTHWLRLNQSKQSCFMTRRSVCSVGLVMILPFNFPQDQRNSFPSREKSVWTVSVGTFCGESLSFASHYLL